MKHTVIVWFGRALTAVIVLLASVGPQPVPANPVGGSVTKGTATFSTQGSQLTVRTSNLTAINWQSFNIGLGQTTTFIQPSSSSIVWNQVSGGSPSQILGNLNANGYVILQNPSGFFIGGQAAITAQGVIFTTAPIPTLNLSAGGPWDFNAPPPSASIINYGQIQAGKGGSVFLIAHDIENQGTITAPQGQIGLYAGKDVLLSERPDGRGLSAKVTLPVGSVDNSGKLIADAGSIAVHAQVVNQGGLVQADSVREVNGTIELVASEAINLSANSVLSAKGGAQGPSPGGSILIKSDGSFSDQAGSSIGISGGAQGGNGGQVEISASQMTAIKSRIDGHATDGFLGGQLLIDPDNIYLTDSGDPFPSSGTVSATDPPAADTLILDVTSLPTGLSQIKLQAVHDIELATVWTLADSSDPKASLTLEAGRNITLDDGSGIVAGRNWSVNLFAGTELTSAAHRQAGMDRIFLQGMAFIQAQNGKISLTAGNDVFMDDGVSDPNSLPCFDSSSLAGNGITTVGGGSISVTSRFGDVNTGGNPYAYSYRRNAPYYSVSTDPGALGGISTAAGGDVTIAAAGKVTSFMPGKGTISDAGSGCFGPQAGNVTVTAGGGVFGHFVEANGLGVITAGANVGATDVRHGFALSLIDGSWSVYAPNGSIYLQEVRNPNGDFNTVGATGSHLFDYGAADSLLLEAGNTVEITGSGLPRGAYSAGTTAPPMILPPTLDIIAGLGGVKIDNDVTLFPSALGELNISAAGSFVGTTLPDGNRPTFLMSDSGRSQWSDQYSFLAGDHAAIPVELANPNPVTLTVGGSMNNLVFATSKQTQITVGGSMNNTAFSGQNLHPTDVTSINVAGAIYNRGLYTFTYLAAPIVSVDWRNPNQWDSIFNLLVDPQVISNPNASQDPSKATTSADLLNIASQVLLFPSAGNNHNPGFVYNSATSRLGYSGVMSSTIRNALEGTLEILRIGADGLPVVANGHFVTDKVAFVPNSAIDALYTGSQDVPNGTSIAGYQIGGPGQLNLHAGSLDLGTTDGIMSLGASANPSLARLTTVGAAVNVDLDGDLSMFTSRIASLFGGNVTINAGGSINLGSQDLFGSSGYAFGVYTTGHSDVSVTAGGNINIAGSRIATYNGGNIFVESLDGSVNAGSGGTSYVSVPIVRNDPKTGLPSVKTTFIYGSGIVAVSLTKDLQTPGGNPLPGDITVETPRGDIMSTTAGILQLPLDGNLAPGPTITLTAGTKPSTTSAGYVGNIDLGDSGVIGGTINMTAQGNINGLIISRQDSVIQAAQNFAGTLLSAGSANVSAGGNVGGTIIGISGVGVSGGSVSAALMSQNVAVGGGPSQNTLAGSSAPSATSAAAAQQANNDTQQKAALPETDTDDKKNPQKKKPTLVRRSSRVTVILPRS